MQFSHIHHTVAWKYHMILLLYNYDFNCAFFMFFWRAFKNTKKSLSLLCGPHLKHTHNWRDDEEKPALLSLLLFFLLMFLANIYHMCFLMRARECCPILKLSHHVCIIFVYPDTPPTPHVKHAANDYWSQFLNNPHHLFFLDFGNKNKVTICCL